MMHLSYIYGEKGRPQAVTFTWNRISATYGTKIQSQNIFMHFGWRCEIGDV